MNEFIVKNNMDFLISKINNKQYFRFPKLLHGFWERIEFLSDGSDDIEVVKNNIKKIGKNFGRRNFEKPPWRSDFFKSNSSLGVGPHYLEIIDLLQKEDKKGNSSGTKKYEDHCANNFTLLTLLLLTLIINTFYTEGFTCQIKTILKRVNIQISKKKSRIFF